jgi:hypothetical protein
LRDLRATCTCDEFGAVAVGRDFAQNASIVHAGRETAQLAVGKASCWSHVHARRTSPSAERRAR